MKKYRLDSNSIVEAVKKVISRKTWKNIL
jgi:hypothetical protein